MRIKWKKNFDEKKSLATLNLLIEKKVLVKVNLQKNLKQNFKF